MRKDMKRRTLWDVSPVLAGLVIAVSVVGALFVLNYVVFPEIDHLSAVAAAATRRFMSRS